VATFNNRTHGEAWARLVDYINATVIPNIASITVLAISYVTATAPGNGYYNVYTSPGTWAAEFVVLESTANADLPMRWMLTQPGFQGPAVLTMPLGTTGAENYYNVVYGLTAAFAQAVNANCGTSQQTGNTNPTTLPTSTDVVSMCYVYVFNTANDFMAITMQIVNKSFADPTYGLELPLSPVYASNAPSSGGGSVVNVQVASPLDLDVLNTNNQLIYSATTLTTTVMSS
jgi:hypothetical protein